METIDKNNILRIFDILKSSHNISINLNMGNAKDGIYVLTVYWNNTHNHWEVVLNKKTDVGLEYILDETSDTFDDEFLDVIYDIFKEYSTDLMEKYLKDK